jgi:hypothetical protein
MATSCSAIRTNLARQTPVFSETFLDDYISDMVNAPFVGRHMTATWDYESDRVYFDKMHVMQPDLLTPWQVIDASECGNACEPPNAFIGFGSTRDSAVMEQIQLRSQPYCLQQLARVPHVGKQMAKIYKVVRNIPLSFTGDFVRTRHLSYHDTLQIAGSAFGTLAVTAGNTATNLATINLGGAGNLPTSELTWPILTYYTQLLGLRGYSQDSGLSKGMYNLITHPRTYQKLVGQNPEIKSQLHLVGVKDVSPLYELNTGVNADPFGPIAPTFDEHQPRFQTNGSGLLQRVLPYTNTAATTGEKPIVNTTWFNARYGLSYIMHPKAATVYTIQPKKIHEMVPTVNSAMWGTWDFVNPEGLIMWVNPDGTTCTKNNDTRFWFYWLCHLELGFQYEQRDLVMPILHLIDGSGKDCVVDSPVCGDAPAYVTQDYTGNPTMCDS